ncbi:chondroitinase family polysaccharide lyase [Cetobacterium somerae]|uniref:chondroitinase family polysaccharide lyase n=1 Tax=Cetobacterium somerae TaxID=188913 RepID=UPI002259C795|nr:chondroitinase family polysaccharide lyase [Cetobacterium somerae]MCX3068119.1 chondroitinase family polysaccharide lyase [Cetobacterium somerae]
MKKIVLGAIMLTGVLYAKDLKVYQFENEMPKNIKVDVKDSVSISKEKYKDGESSLKWKFKKGEALSILGDVGYTVFKTGEQEKARSSYSMWIYNEEPIDGEMLVQFKKDGIVKCWFPIKMNFKGWRTMWVQYDRDMKGEPIEGMDEITFVAPNESGEILIDQIIPSVLIDPRHNARDEQVDFINLEADTAANAHWMALYKNYNQIDKNEKKIVLNESETEGIKKVEKRYREKLLKKVQVTPELIAEKEMEFSEYKKINLEFIQRLVIYKDLKPEEKEKIKYIATKEFGIYLRELAYMYNSTDNVQEKEKIAKLFNESLEYMYDQGWTKGSSQGTIHHLGYQMREIYDAIFLMKEPLVKLGTVNKAKEMVTWYSAMGMIYTPKENLKGVNIDVLNTMLPGMLAAILLNESKEKESKELYQLQSYLMNSIKYSPGVLGGFKYDGTVFHHMQNYPAYAKGAFEGLVPIIYYLNGTSYAVTGEQYKIVKNSVLTTRLYSNKYNYLLSLTGRHPNGKFKIDSEGFRLMALSGEGGVDKELAQAYLRLDSQGKSAEKFRNMGLKEERAPQGSWTMNMGSLQLHRRKEWLVGVKGYSRYLVGNETYIKNNLYGRYMSYGAFQILEGSLKESGYVQEGWDWKHFPGTTAIDVPFEKLKSNISQVDTKSGVEEMLLSDETYSGGNSLNDNGMFAMKLHEHPKYNGTHRARKSVFFFNNKAILLGSGIENNDSENETHTTLFQNYLGQNLKNSYIQKEDAIIDSQNNLYKIVEGDVVLKKGKQESKDQNSGEKTENNYELAYINHGKAPKNGKYHYSILIKGNNEEQEKFRKNSKYEVLNQDNSSHIVKDLKSDMIGYALFESGKVQNNRFIESVDTPSMILLQEKGKEIQMSFVDPDLRLYEGRDEEQYDKNGVMIERSIYSRPWIGNEGKEHIALVILKGKYNVDNNPKVKSEIDGDFTKLSITSKNGEPVKIILKDIS